MHVGSLYINVDHHLARQAQKRTPANNASTSQKGVRTTWPSSGTQLSAPTENTSYQSLVIRAELYSSLRLLYFQQPWSERALTVGLSRATVWQLLVQKAFELRRPNLLRGSADLTPSRETIVRGRGASSTLQRFQNGGAPRTKPLESLHACKPRNNVRGTRERTRHANDARARTCEQRPLPGHRKTRAPPANFPSRERLKSPRYVRYACANAHPRHMHISVYTQVQHARTTRVLTTNGFEMLPPRCVARAYTDAHASRLNGKVFLPCQSVITAYSYNARVGAAILLEPAAYASQWTVKRRAIREGHTRPDLGAL